MGSFLFFSIYLNNGDKERMILTINLILKCCARRVEIFQLHFDALKFIFNKTRKKEKFHIN